MYDYDLFVIGAGSGGVRASRIASSLGAKVAIAEEYRFGGTCVIRGCVPKKLMVFASHFSENFKDAEGFGWVVGESRFSWPKLIKNKDREIDRLESIYKQILGNANVKTFNCRATIKDEHTLQVGDKVVTAETILVATGGAPNMPNIPGVKFAISSNEAFHLEDLPPRVLISGAGFIAVEFAGIFNGLGSNVEVVYRGDKLLRGFDEDLRNRLGLALSSKGVNIRYNAKIVNIVKKDTGLFVSFDNGENQEYDCVMFAIGRNPNTSGLGLENTGVKLQKNGAIFVDGFSRTNISNIYAVGDVTSRVNLTPVAIKEGNAFAQTLYGNNPISPEHDNVPSAVFSQPPIGTVGPTEGMAKANYGALDIYVSDFKPMRNTLAERDERAFVKLIVDQASQKVLAAHMIGEDAPEIIQGVAIAIKNGLTKQQFDNTLAIHPSSAEEFVLMTNKRDS
ncbi:MAG: glutathione-disulfide reductase [Sphingomonadales bacterium]